MNAHRWKRKPAEHAPPHAGRMTWNLTALDYTFERAVADVVDNSITAGARQIWIEINSGTESRAGIGPFVCIVDDGKGMTKGKLVGAMQYAAKSQEGEEGLGKYGLGMKTASTSQANVLSVASRASTNGPFAVRAWDLPFLRDKARWILLGGSIDEFPPVVKKRLRGSSGTAILWTDLVRALPDHKRQSDDEIDRAMNDFARETIDHLSIVYNRFLTGNTTGRRRKVAISVNGIAVEPRDPLLREHPNTVVLTRKAFVVRNENGKEASFFLTPAILPRQDQFVDSEGNLDRKAHSRAGGPRGWNAGQGFYMYRLDRLIQGGGWNRLRAADEHAKTARIDVDLTRSSDDLFSLNVSKTRVLLPRAVKDEIRDFTAKIVSRAKDAYGGRKTKARKKKAKPPRKLPRHGPRKVLNTLYESCKSQKERSTLTKIVEREYPGYRPAKEK